MERRSELLILLVLALYVSLRIAKNICHTTMVQRAWRNSKALSVHGCIYTLETGLLKDLGVRYSHMHDLNSIFQLKEAKKAVYEPNLKVMETDYEGR